MCFFLSVKFTSAISATDSGSGSASSGGSNNNSRKKGGGVNLLDGWDFAHSASELAELATLNQFNTSSSQIIDLAVQQNQQLENEVCLLSETAALKLCHSFADEVVHHSKRFVDHSNMVLLPIHCPVSSFIG